MRNYSKQWCSESNPHAKDKIMFNKLFNNLFGKKTVVVALDKNVKLTVEPAVGGGARATLEENGAVFTRRETCWFANINDLAKSLTLTDDALIRKLSKAF